jgi:predicted AAA+ superfamily ATPase
VFVAGARQVGKTALVGDIAGHERRMPAFTLEDRATREAAIREDVDVVMENNRGEVVGVEVKAATTLRATAWKWLKKLADNRAEDFKAGIVVYAGAQTLPLGSRLWAMPYSGLWA